jgi:CheY-like chemotaxis protein
MARILVAEDDAGMRGAIEAALQQDGFDVTTVVDGRSALALVRTCEFQLVLADVRMPHMTGLELLPAVKQVKPDLPVLLMTGYSTVDDAVKAMNEGAADYLTKPLDFGTLLKTVGELTNGAGEMESHVFTCGYCGQPLTAVAGHYGNVITCPGCLHAITVPYPRIGVGSVLDGYQLGEMIGSGAICDVHEATALATGESVAVKIFRPGLHVNNLLDRFQVEIELCAMLEHPNLVRAHAAGKSHGVLYLAMDRVYGDNLQVKVDGGGIFPECEALKVAAGVAAALEYAWDTCQLLHRDVKPENIMIDTDGTVKLLDLGLAKSLDAQHGLTLVPTAMGTPRFFSPEQAGFDVVIDCRTDIYSLGATLYFLVPGQPSFSGAVMEIIRQVLNEDPIPVDVLAAVSPECAHLIDYMMQKHPDDRPKDWSEVRRLVDDLLNA